jgi:hypothetical protein
MADVVQTAAPAANTPATSAETPTPESTEVDLDAAEAAEEAAEGSEASKSDEKVEAKDDKKGKKEEKAKEKRLKKLKLKVDGKEIEEELDLDDDEALIRQLQMAKMGSKRAQEKSDLEKQIKSFFEAFEKDPFATMKELGKNPDALIDQYINQQLENAKKSPEQVEKERIEAELKSIKAEREREREEVKKRELERLQQQAFQQYDMQMEQSLSKSSLPKTPYIVKKIADYMLVGLEAGYDVSPEDVIPLVQEELNSDLKDMFSSLPEEQVEALLGEQVLNKLRKRRVAKAAAAQAAVTKPKIQDSGKAAKTEKTEGEKKSYKDFFGI